MQLKFGKNIQIKKLMERPIESGHHIPEQNPKQIIYQLKNFFLKYKK